MHLTCFCVRVCVRFGQHHDSLCMCEFKRFPALHETVRKKNRGRKRWWGEERESRSDCGACRPPSQTTLVYAFSRSQWTELHACSSTVGTEDCKWNTVNKIKGCIKYVSLRNTSFFSTIKTLLCHWPVLSTLLTPPPENKRTWLTLKIPPFIFIP